jgi:hypothetical protein
MRIPAEGVAAIGSLGYTPEEARFLYTVATFSGYFVPRQFIAFTSSKWGSRSTNFTRKLESRGHASWREYPHLDGVYHLWSKLLYRLIDKENLHNSRRHSPDFIRTRLLTLDFVIANQHCDYLETEADKVRYFREQLGLADGVLPAKEFGSRWRPGPVVRYFVDHFPVYFDSLKGSSRSLVTFTYVDPGQASVAGFRHYLELYKQLFSSLPAFALAYLSNSSAHFTRVQECFSSFVECAFQNETVSALLRYFTLRAKWDAKRFAELSGDELESLELLSRRFQGSDVERVFSSWCAGQSFSEELGSFLGNTYRPRDVHFECRLVSRGMAQVTDASEVGRCGDLYQENQSGRKQMALVKKPPETIERGIRLEEPVCRLLDDYCKFVDCTADYVANFALKRIFAHDAEFKKWKAAQAAAPTTGETAVSSDGRRTA